MVTDIHIILTYKCILECDHCFLYSSPRAQGTMTIQQIRFVLLESQKIKSIKWIYFEGGEPLLFYPLLLEGIRFAKNMGFKVGLVTNAYGAISKEDAEIWFKPLLVEGIDCLSISDDSFHFGDVDSPSKRGLLVAKKLGIPTFPISIQQPYVDSVKREGREKGSPIIGGGAKFRGRAVEKLIGRLPHRSCGEFIKCPYEDSENPSRVHVDCYGNVQLCQGISMGNMWEYPLSKLVDEYDVDLHPICGPLSKGGPFLLAKKYGSNIEKEYIDECHFCYSIRKKLINRFVKLLTPKQVYGIETTVI